jgi:rare lipoprotein A
MRVISKVALAGALIVFATTFTSLHTIAGEQPVQVASGIASWYGGQFHGRTTASGEPFDMNGLTAAHPSLPFGSKVRVTNRTNDASVVVRINDRGPFVGNRVIDLSRAAAQAVRLIGPGLAPVKLEVIRNGSG